MPPAPSEILVLAAPDRIDSDSATAIVETLTAAIDGGHRHLVFDCTALSYLSSPGLRAILMAVRRASENGGRLVLCNVDERIRRVFTISGVDSVVTLRQDVAAARRTLAADTRHR